ncbi:MAG: hypothetical protein ABJ239_00100 [Erythrobacter sp.]
MLRKSRFNPSAGIADFWHEFTKPTPYRWPVLAVSLSLSFGLLYMVTKERYYYPPERPTIEYITSFEPDRSDAEIVASNEENQRQQDELAAEREAILEQKRELYRTLGRATGLDVDAMERQIAEEEAQEAAELERIRSEREELQAEQRAEENSGQ